MENTKNRNVDKNEVFEALLARLNSKRNYELLESIHKNSSILEILESAKNFDKSLLMKSRKTCA